MIKRILVALDLDSDSRIPGLPRSLRYILLSGQMLA